jgi:hypothetical protein
MSTRYVCTNCNLDNPCYLQASGIDPYHCPSDGEKANWQIETPEILEEIQSETDMVMRARLRLRNAANEQNAQKQG